MAMEPGTVTSMEGEPIGLDLEIGIEIDRGRLGDLHLEFGPGFRALLRERVTSAAAAMLDGRSLRDICLVGWASVGPDILESLSGTRLGRLSGLTIALDKALARTAEKFGRYYPLSVLPIIDYLVRKKVEMDNIRIIARGKEMGLSNEVMEELLVI